jgi:hypothetical protein
LLFLLLFLFVVVVCFETDSCYLSPAYPRTHNSPVSLLSAGLEA